MQFYTGWDSPVNSENDCQNFAKCVVSLNRLINRKSDFPANDWILDNGAFTRLLAGKGQRLSVGAWVGVGSLKRRRPEEILVILQGIKKERPDLQLHGFGLGYKILNFEPVRELLYSADSQAGSLCLGKGGKKYVDQHNPKLAIAYGFAVENRINLEDALQQFGFLEKPEPKHQQLSLF